MTDERELIVGTEEPSKGKRERKPKEKPKIYRDVNVYDDDDDDASKGHCTCRKAFFCSVEGILKIIEFVSFH